MGKRLRDALVHGLQKIGVPLTGWLPFAQLNDGRDWKLKTRALALRYTPVVPRGEGNLPDRAAERDAILASPLPRISRGRQAELTAAQKAIDLVNELSNCFLAWEAGLPQSTSAWQSVGQQAEVLCGPDWASLDPDSVLEKLCEQDSWNLAIGSALDFALFKMVLRTAQDLALRTARLADSPPALSPFPVRPPRRRLQSKQMRQPAFFAAEVAEHPIAESGRERDVYWQRLPPSDPGSGPFQCTISGCGRRFTTKLGLANHLRETHKEGTYRDRTWDCPHCPRTFDLESGLTKRLPLHAPGAVAYVCCVCSAYFPGKDSARMHINHNHSAYSLAYPLNCPYCPTNHPFVSHSAHQYSLRWLRAHVYS